VTYFTDFFGTELEDGDRVAYRRGHTEEYWIGDVTAYIGKVSSITKEHLELVRSMYERPRQYVIILFVRLSGVSDSVVRCFISANS
jgi:hypothetical protein